MAKRISWYYRRNNCTTCAKSDAFLKERSMTAREIVDARKVKLGKREIAAILRKTSKVYAMRGKKSVEFDLKRDPPMEKVLYENLIGPTGSLRAPAVRSGKTLVVGFNEEVWKQILV